jgi:hypothetical protein
MSLDQVHCVPGLCLAPHGVDHLLAADWSTCLQRKHRQDYPLLNRPESHDDPVPPDPERAQDAES